MTQNGTMSTRNSALVTVLTTLLLLLPVLRVVVVVEAEAAESDEFNPTSTQPCPLLDPLMDPKYEEGDLDGEYFVWQIPPKPKAVLIIGHGGGMTPLSFFDPAPQCERCYGLPEDRRVVLEALQRGYAVIVVKSIGMGYLVEWPIETSQDLVMVTRIIKRWRREHSLEHLPIAVWAHSAGGPLATGLTMTLPISGLVLMNCLGLTEVEELATPSTFPPTFLVRMPVDQKGDVFNISIKTPEVIATLGERGVEVVHTDLWPKQILPFFFAERIRCMSDKLSQNIYGALKAQGWLDENDYLTMNPRAYDWRIVLAKENVLPICVASGDLCFAADVEEELVDAYAEHSFTSDANDEIFPWLDSKMQSPIFHKPLTLLSLLRMVFTKSALHGIFM